MAKVRSPNYPMLDLGAALQAARKAYANDHRNKMSRIVLAKHLGHDSLSGPALGKIGALRAYGLIDGNADEIRITNEAVHALEAPEGSAERAAAISQLALRPKLFQDIRKDFPGAVSPDNLRFWLIKRDFVPEAAEKAAKTYLATMRLVDGGTQAYNSVEEPEKQEPPLMNPAAQTPRKDILDLPASLFKAPPMLQEVFNLEEGPVTLTVPGVLSPESYQDMADRIEIFLRGLKRRSDAEAARRRADREDAPE
ncbi:hypothetical protein [Bradyrhizobium genosp. A]|uniref:hypothetical protein n=1 Tax=Bradyrhizobium genosp. A TaxID=83626 RepID=UPI003CF8F116